MLLVPLSKNIEIKELNIIHVVDINSHEIKNDILGHYIGEFERVGKRTVGDQIRETHIRFRNFTDYEAYINAIDEGYEGEDSIFNGYIYKINTLQFILVNRSQYGNGCDFKNEVFEYRGNNCFITTKGHCFVKCINCETNSDYKEQYHDFIKIERRRSNIMTMARIQPCLRKLGNNLGCYNGKQIWPRYITERNKALFIQNNHFCLIE